MSKPSPVITLAELNTVYKDLIDRINVASVYNFIGEITITNMINTNLEPNIDKVNVGDIYEIHGDMTLDEIDIAKRLNLQKHDNIACKKEITKGTILSINPDEDNYWGNYWTEVGSYMQLADKDHNGFVSTSEQKFSGHKIFLDDVTVGKSLIVEGDNPNTGNITTSILNITGGSSNVTTLTAEKIKVSDTATFQNLSGPGTTLTVKSGGSTTVNTIDGVSDGTTTDYADFNVNGTVTCRDFNAENQKINATTNTSNISCIDNTSTVLKASETVSCKEFDASGQSIKAQQAESELKNIYTKTGVLTVLGESIKCDTFDASNQKIKAQQAESELKNISSTTATLNDVSSVTCGSLDLGSQSLIVNSTTTFSSVSKKTDSPSPSLTTSGIITCGDVTLKGTDNTTHYPLTVNKEVTLSGISGNSAAPTLKTSGTITCGDITLKGTDDTYKLLTVNKEVTLSGISGNSTSPTLKTSGTITCGNFDNGTNSITTNNDLTFSSISNLNSSNKPAGTSKLKSTGLITCSDFNVGSYNITSSDTTNTTLTFSSISNNSSSSSKLTSTGTITCTDFSVSKSSITSSMTSGLSFSTISSANTLSSSGTITCKDFSVTGSNISSTTTGQSISFSTVGDANKLSSSGTITCKDFNVSGSDISSSTADQSISFSTVNNASTLSASGTITCKDFSNTSGTIKNNNTGNTTFSNITGSGTLDVSGTLYCGDLNVGSGTGTVRVPKVELGDGTIKIPIELNTSKTGADKNQKYWANCIVIGNTSLNDDDRNRGDLIVNGHIFAGKVHNAVWNDLVDCIPVNEDVQLEYGYCYSFDGKKYHKSNKHCDSQFIGIHSDTSGMRMGERPCKTLDVAISGFVLAYVDSYKPGTPLVCGKNGRLEKATLFDKVFKPYRIIATYWKDEKEEEYGPESSKIKVNGRNWVKIK